MNELFEISPMNKLPRKLKRDSITKSQIDSLYSVIEDHWCYVVAYQKKKNKIRVVCNFRTFKGMTNKLKQTNRLGWKIIR